MHNAEYETGPGGGRKHKKHGRGSENSGAAQSRHRQKQQTLTATISRENEALAAATQELNDLKTTKSQVDFKLILGNLTEEQWIRQRQLKIFKRK